MVYWNTEYRQINTEKSVLFDILVLPSSMNCEHCSDARIFVIEWHTQMRFLWVTYMRIVQKAYNIKHTRNSAYTEKSVRRVYVRGRPRLLSGQFSPLSIRSAQAFSGMAAHLSAPAHPIFCPLDHAPLTCHALTGPIWHIEPVGTRYSTSKNAVTSKSKFLGHSMSLKMTPF